MAQRTLKGPIACTGTGLHSGRKVEMLLLPAAPNHGIVFRRRDIPGENGVLKADFRNVRDTRMCSMLANDAGTRIGTVEHLMAALYGAEIDNLTVELDADEVPVMDGSSAPFLFLVDCAGTIEQAAPRRAIEVLEPVTIEDGDARITLAPGAGFAAEFEIDFKNAAIGRQTIRMGLEPGAFRREIARARTFGFEHEVASLRAMGLARGGSLDNAVVVSGERILNEDGLRFEDEFVRHKILDLVGDFYLAGAPILGDVRATRTGHRHNNALLHALLARPEAWRWTEMTAETYAGALADARLGHASD
ncbi:MAG: UDP-3-O-acyl-N-acetylglucosamine deacetylase [Alphaproteobacteria bacterium]|nr:UDP-3-O-acyl-N-acetylglucosamine deacetylase [Alphaproteobacteria bacterium]